MDAPQTQPSLYMMQALSAPNWETWEMNPRWYNFEEIAPFHTIVQYWFVSGFVVHLPPLANIAITPLDSKYAAVAMYGNTSDWTSAAWQPHATFSSHLRHQTSSNNCFLSASDDAPGNSSNLLMKFIFKSTFTLASPRRNPPKVSLTYIATCSQPSYTFLSISSSWTLHILNAWVGESVALPAVATAEVLATAHVIAAAQRPSHLNGTLCCMER
mmetsp:Transcript_101730/g.311089  ORF Transcript_101730/g.311089 Transcript_101730/m.311089 type:complete len:214 (+) Transcript_101730:160-801(+)